MAHGIFPTTHHFGSALTTMAFQQPKDDFPPELLIVPYSLLTVITAYYSYKRAYTFVSSAPKLLAIYQLPKAASPQICGLIRDLRNQAFKMTVGDVAAAVGISHLVPVPVYSQTLGIVAALDGVLTVALKFLEPKYCDDPNGKPKHDDVTVLEKLQELVNGWNPQPGGAFGRSPVKLQNIDWRPSSEGDFVESDGVGTALTFLAVLGGMAAAGAASALSWSAESAMETGFEILAWE